MVAELIRRLANSLVFMALLFLFLIATLYFVANTGEHLDSFGRSYQWLIYGTAIVMGLIGILILSSVWRLVVDLRRNVSGSRLTLKLVIMLVVMALLPMTLVYSFSVKFLRSNIDSWFDVEVERALDDALGLSRDALTVYMRTRQKTTAAIAQRLSDTPVELAIVVLNDIGSDSEASELTLIGPDNRVIATTAFADLVSVAPERPAGDLIVRARNGRPYLSIDPADDGDLQVRSVMPVFSSDPANAPAVLYATYPVPRSSSQLAASVQESFRNYRQLAYLRAPLKQSSIATLTLSVFLSLMMAVWVAIYAARRLMVPVHDLVEGTRLVSQGDYSTRLTTSGRDELGYLVQSFNDMTDKIEAARANAASSQAQAEDQRAYLELVLSRISTGVITIDENHSVKTSNASAEKILQATPEYIRTINVDSIETIDNEFVRQFFTSVQSVVASGHDDWSLELELAAESDRIPVMCRGSTIKSGAEIHAGHVLVFDDISDVVAAQRNAAWSEVARRLAHEIKNPLTPIQLSAERLQHKYARKLHGDDASTLMKLTKTIVTQVEAMKSMVKAFADYANSPHVDFKSTNLNELVTETCWLYREGDERDAIVLDLDPATPLISSDPTRVRQVLHNVIKNAFETVGGADVRKLWIITRSQPRSDMACVQMVFEDNGPGFPPELLDRLFEPYVTSKNKGTGLGLAIVKKIVEEHGGVVHAENIVEQQSDGETVVAGGRLLVSIPAYVQRAVNSDTTLPATKSIKHKGDAEHSARNRPDFHGDAA
ncbi:hypothetical protein AB833_23695 [Chromatiales bacterium (ex Bugula neritina AB1)]|nr:hypothetical protein AB833_23695 [Chromatiales bacterium (ex Bugula neritina AB1)]